jgi:hypothetical protein
MTESSASRQAWDRIQIEDLARRYAHGVDERDWEKVDSCFLPDAYIRGQLFAGAYAEYSPRLRQGVESFGTTMHFLGNQTVTFGNGTAAVVTYGIAYHLASRTSAGDFVTGVRYLDDVVRADNGWAVANRVVQGIWRRPYGDEVQVLPPTPSR